MVYAAQPPLFAVKHKGEQVYAYSDEQREQLHAELGLSPDKRWQRFKGLGEMNVNELKDTTLDPSTRVLKRLTMADAEHALEAAKLFEVLMGSDVATRREYIVENSTLIDREELDV